MQSASKFLVTIAVVCLFIFGILFVGAQDNDGRLNYGNNLGGLAVYCINSAGVPGNTYGTGVRILNWKGDEVIFIPAETLDASAMFPSENTLIAEDGRFSLYRLTTGELQLNSVDVYGKSIAFTWSCASETQATETAQSAPDLSQELGSDDPIITEVPSMPSDTTAIPTMTNADLFPTATVTLTSTFTPTTFFFTDAPTSTPTFTFMPTDAGPTRTPTRTPRPTVAGGCSGGEC